MAGTILGAPGGIVDTVKTAAETERVFDWAERAYAPFLAPAGAVSGIADGYYYRHYPSTGAYVGVKAGEVHYRGPASGHQVLRMGTLAEFLGRAQAAGY